MNSLATHFFHHAGRPYVRPWGLAVPIIVLIFCLPLLRPLRHPGRMSSDEEARLATISALVEHDAPINDSGDHSPAGNRRGAWLANRLAIDPNAVISRSHLLRVNNQVYSDQPPMMAFLLSGPYWVLRAMGFHAGEYSVLVPYLLTVLGVTLPVAGCAGLIYRMGRVFELRRPWRCGLAAVVVFGTGLVSYGVVLNPHVPAAFLVLASAGCLTHWAASTTPGRNRGWLVIAGLHAALAATIDPPAVIFLLLFLGVIVAIRLRPGQRAAGTAVYILGALLPLSIHAALTIPITGDLLPGSMHPELALHRPSPDGAFAQDISTLATAATDEKENEAIDSGGFWQQIWMPIYRAGSALLGQHGLLVHFPILILGFIGMLGVMHRHWPATTKVLAAVSAAGIVLGLGLIVFNRPMMVSSEFACAPLLLFLPILLFWSGAWLRNHHHPAVWATVSVLLAFSVLVTLIGAADPMPPRGFDGYTPVAAMHNLIHSPSLDATATTVAQGD